MAPVTRLQDQAIERFWETVPPLWGLVRAHLRAEATGNFDITVEQFHVLRFVRRGTDSISELAAARNISRPAVSQAIDVLVRKGLVTRVQSTQDRRYVDLALSEAGDRLLDTVFSETRRWMRGLMEGLSAEELETVSRAMDILKKTLPQ